LLQAEASYCQLVAAPTYFARKIKQSSKQLRYGTLFRLSTFDLTMEGLFSPCTRLHDLAAESQGLDPPEVLQEINLDVSTDVFLSAERGFAYADLYAMLGNENVVAWLTPHAAVVMCEVAREDGQVLDFWRELGDEWFYFRFVVDGKAIIAFTGSLEHLLEICDVVHRLLAASVVHSVVLDNADFVVIYLSTQPDWRI
jgi:hypothetical protein